MAPKRHGTNRTLRILFANEPRLFHHSPPRVRLFVSKQAHPTILTSPLTCSYVGSRFYLHDPPGDKTCSRIILSPEEVLRMEKELRAEPEVNLGLSHFVGNHRSVHGVTAEFVGHNFLSTLRAIVLTLLVAR